MCIGVTLLRTTTSKRRHNHDTAQANGLLATLTSNLIQITDGKIARDIYQDSNGDYHQGINGMGNDNFANTIHGSENITDALYINEVKMIWYE